MKKFVNKIYIKFFNFLYTYFYLSKQAGKIRLTKLFLISITKSILDLFGFGLLCSILFKSNLSIGSLNIVINFSQKIIFLMLIIASRNALQIYANLTLQRLRLTYTDQLREDLLENILRSSSDKLENVSKSELLGLFTTDIQRSVHSLDQSMVFIQAFFSSVIYVLGIILFSKKSIILISLGISVIVLILIFQRSNSKRLGILQTEINISLQKIIGDGVNSIKTIRSANAEDWFIQRFLNENARLRKTHQIILKNQLNFNNLKDLLILIIFMIWFSNQNANYDSSNLIILLLIIYRTASSFGLIVQSFRSYSISIDGFINLNRINKTFINANRKLNERNVIKKGKNFESGNINSIIWKSKKINFQLNKSLKFEKGNLYVVTGKSGVGKTTLLDNLCGLINSKYSYWEIKTNSKTLYLNGEKGSSLMRHLISYGPQKTTLFEGTLIENLMLNCLTQAKEDLPSLFTIKKLMNKLGIINLLNREGNLEQNIPLASEKFSGGEIKKIGFIRTLLKRSQIIILDEPTISLDNTSVIQMISIIKSVLKEKIIIIASHNSEIIGAADKLITL